MGQTRSFNCCSCGAGLYNPIGDTSKCRYCGNYNKILSNGVTLIYTKQEEEKEVEWKDMSLKHKFVVGMVLVVLPVILARHYKR